MREATATLRTVSSVAVGVLAGLTAVARIIIVNRDAFESLLWAEDGLFPICIYKAGFWACTLDPFAGYLVGAPRFLAAAVAPWPIALWPLVTNVLAAIVAGLICAWVFFMTVRVGLAPAFALLLALIPIATPIVGLEAVNVTASMYLLLLYGVSVVLATADSRVGAWPLAIILFITAITMPTAVLLIPVIVFIARRGRLAVRTAVLGIAGLVVGLLVQAAVIIAGSGERRMGLSGATFVDWVQALPSSLLTLWPGLGDQGAFLFDRFPITPFAFTGWVVLIGGLWAAIAGLRSSRVSHQASGMLMLLGLGFSAIPALTGVPGNRYFVPVVTLWAAAGVVWLADRAVGWHRWVPWAVIAFVAVLWWPMFPASQFRHASDPSWPAQLEAASTACASGDASTRVTLVPTPQWPDGVTRLREPSTMVIDCATFEAAQ